MSIRNKGQIDGWIITKWQFPIQINRNSDFLGNSWQTLLYQRQVQPKFLSGIISLT